MADKNQTEVNIGYEIKRSILFENNRGFVLAQNIKRSELFVTWQFTEENGRRDYYWGHYTADGEAANKDYEFRVADYQRRYRGYEKVTPKSIFEQMKEGAEQATRDNAARPAPAKSTDKDRN